MERCLSPNNFGWMCQLEKGHKGMHKCVGTYETMEWNYNREVAE